MALALALLGGFPAPPKAYSQSALVDLFKGEFPNNEKKDTEVDLKTFVETGSSKGQEELNQVRAELENPSLDRQGRAYQWLKEQEGSLQELLLYYTQIREESAKQEELQKRLEETKNSIEAWNAETFRESVDRTFEEYNALEDQSQIEQGQLEATEQTLQILKTNLEETEENFKQLEIERRRTKEELEGNSGGEQGSELSQKLAALKLESRLAEAKIRLLKTEIRNQEANSKIYQSLNLLTQKKLTALEGEVKFSEEALQLQISDLENEKKELTKKLKDARDRVQQIQKELTHVPAESDRSHLLQLEKSALQQQISLMSSRFQRLDENKETWRHRYLAYNNLAKKDQLLGWEKESREYLEQSQRREQLVSLYLSDLNKNIVKVHERLAGPNGAPPEKKRHLEAEAKIMEDLARAHQEFLSQLYREIQLNQKFLNEIEPRISTFSPMERVKAVWSGALKVWNYEITSIDDKAITVKKLVFVIILSVLGLRFSRKLAQWFGGTLLPKLGFEAGVAAGLQTLSFYLLVTLVILLVLYIVNVPLTIFTVLGGALAIGVGFGSQNILRNFISGLILLAERPIKVGDMIQMDDTYGVIERIGARSTLIRSFDNIHIILPNSDFLEKKVINWTLSDDIVRIAVNVGVIYGSPTQEVARLIRKAVDEQGKVLKSPEPLVLFTDFGDNSLNFQTLFWIRMRTQLERKKVESNIRYRIDELFREAGIVIAFPQRDVHLDNIKPLEVRILGKNSEPMTPFKEK